MTPEKLDIIVVLIIIIPAINATNVSRRAIVVDSPRSFLSLSM